MPNSYTINIAVNEMGLDEKDKELIEFSVSCVRTMEASGHIVWKDLSACMDLLGATYSAELDRFIPDLGQSATGQQQTACYTFLTTIRRRQGTAAGRMNNGKTTNLSGAAL